MQTVGSGSPENYGARAKAEAKPVRKWSERDFVTLFFFTVILSYSTKSMTVEAKDVRKGSARDFVTLFFVTVSCLVLALTRLILCI
ncbi:hypothetical protein Nepgr_012503 [Nepenthes gracilis]|uniref:Uncharacterized protein n=1 Tax=Nepenthes gracilis TaxID=150966 RepID=A0AAD3XMV0_NEPGR|nr:hypothetical protein Nepgr_012503 [Nepenthes gracilis]